MDVADEQIDSLTQGVMGVTVACARCHDHKFDPITQREYYAMAGIFLSTETRYGTGSANQNRNPMPLIELPAKAGVATLARTLAPADRASKERDLAELKKDREDIFASRIEDRKKGVPTNNDAQKNIKLLALIGRIGTLETELASYDDSGRSKALAMGAQDRPVTKGDSFVGAAIREGLGKRFTADPRPTRRSPTARSSPAARSIGRARKCRAVLCRCSARPSHRPSRPRPAAGGSWRIG